MISRSYFSKACLAANLLLLSGGLCLLHGQSPSNPPATGQPQASSPAAPDANGANSAGPGTATPSTSSPATTAPTATPGERYKDATRPLELVRGSMDNWSDAEMGALTVGIHKAREACQQTKPDGLSPEDLYDLARLCSFGQDWNAANTAALDYVAGGWDAHRAQAYALSISAEVRLNGVDLAVGTAREMLRKLPYDAEVAYALRYLEDYLDKAGNLAALKLAEDEHPAIVNAIAAGVPLKAVHGDAVIGLGPLYEAAMELAFLQRYAGEGLGAGATVNDIDDALAKATALPWEDRQRIDAIRTRYALLGTHLPGIEIKQALFSKSAKAQIGPSFGVATVLVLFPDWCAQCRRMMKTLTDFAAVNGDVPVYAYGLTFEDDPEGGAQATHEDNLKDLEGTETLVVSADTAKTLGAMDYPLGILLDGAGSIRNVEVLPIDAFNGDSYIGKIIKQMVNREVGGVKVE